MRKRRMFTVPNFLSDELASMASRGFAGCRTIELPVTLRWYVVTIDYLHQRSRHLKAMLASSSADVIATLQDRRQGVVRSIVLMLPEDRGNQHWAPMQVAKVWLSKELNADGERFAMWQSGGDKYVHDNVDLERVSYDLLWARRRLPRAGLR